MRRIGCFSHTLQLVALNFDNYVGFKELLKRTHDLIRKVNSSTKATERLINACGKKTSQELSNTVELQPFND